MADSPITTPPIPRLTAEDIGQHEEHSVAVTRSMLQRADARLNGHTSRRAQPSDSFVKTENTLPRRVTKLHSQLSNESYIKSELGVARIDRYRTVDERERKLASRIKPTALSRDPPKKSQPKSPRSTAGSDWFHLPRTNLTPELKRDLQLLSMRSAWDPKRHYKKDNRKSLVPEFSHAGTIIEGPTEHFSSRIAKRDRKKTFVDEIMADEGSSGRFRKKSIDIQASKTSGRRAFYNMLKQKRSKGSARP
ncbi:MAG: hypothetical protein Q9168_001002 [Polycauliona sp. 1 TL-2023]